MWHEGLKIHLTRQPFHEGIAVYITQITEFPTGRKVARAKSLIFEEIPETIGSMPLPAFMLTINDAQRFMDELWQCGLRPSEGTGSAGALAATQRHLEDLRHLVFKTKPRETKQ